MTADSRVPLGVIEAPAIISETWPLTSPSFPDRRSRRRQPNLRPMHGPNIKFGIDREVSDASPRDPATCRDPRPAAPEVDRRLIDARLAAEVVRKGFGG